MAPVTNLQDARAKVDAYVAENKVVIFSKSYCPYCDRVKDLFKGLGATYFAIELDELAGDEGNLLQAALKAKTNQSTVPNVFVGTKHIGGNDDTRKLHAKGGLVPLLG